MMKDRKIAFDFDGVIADTSSVKKLWLQNKGINLDKVDKTNFYESLKGSKSQKEINMLYKEMSKEIFTTKTLENTKPVNSSINILEKLCTKFEIYIITARTEELIKPVKKWLKKYKIEHCIKDIISSSFEEKQDICRKNNIISLCDDDIRHIEKDKINLKIWFCNENICKNINSNIVIAKSWNEIEKILV